MAALGLLVSLEAKPESKKTARSLQRAKDWVGLSASELTRSGPIAAYSTSHRETSTVSLARTYQGPI